jgi:hypothetical protein
VLDKELALVPDGHACCQSDHLAHHDLGHLLFRRAQQQATRRQRSVLVAFVPHDVPVEVAALRRGPGARWPRPDPPSGSRGSCVSERRQPHQRVPYCTRNGGTNAQVNRWQVPATNRNRSYGCAMNFSPDRAERVSPGDRRVPRRACDPGDMVSAEAVAMGAQDSGDRQS